MALKTHELRISDAHRLQLIAMGLNYVVYRAKDVGVTEPGHIESAFSHKTDADIEALRLCDMYARIDTDSFAVADLCAHELAGNGG